MTLEEMQDAIAAKTKPPRETVMAMYGGKMPSIATLARRESIASTNGQQRGGGSKRDTPHRTRQDACTAIARAAQNAQQLAISKARTTTIVYLITTPMTIKMICKATGIPKSSVQKILEQLMDDGKVSRVKHYQGARWSLVRDD